MQMKLLLQSISILYFFELAIKAKLTETELKKIPFLLKRVIELKRLVKDEVKEEQGERGSRGDICGYKL